MSDYILISGQTVSGLVVSAGTYLEIGSGGVAISTLVKDGGYETVFFRGRHHIHHHTGGRLRARLLRRLGGGHGSVKLVVSSGQVSSGLVANTFTSIYVIGGGVTSGTLVTSGGTEILSALGRDVGTTVQAGGYDIISGVSINAVVSGAAVIQGGTTSGLTITGSGTVAVENAVLGFSVLSNTTITGHGTLTVSDGTDVSGTVVLGGAATFVISNSVMPFATISGFTSTNTLDLAGVTYTSGGNATLSDGSLVIQDGGQTYVLQLGGPLHQRRVRDRRRSVQWNPRHGDGPAALLRRRHAHRNAAGRSGGGAALRRRCRP